MLINLDPGCCPPLPATGTATDHHRWPSLISPTLAARRRFHIPLIIVPWRLIPLLQADPPYVPSLFLYFSLVYFVNIIYYDL